MEGLHSNIASQYGHIDIVKYLINAGAEFKEGNNKGWTPLHSACEKGYLDIVEHLVSLGADVNKVKNDGSDSSSCCSMDMVSWTL